MNELVINQAGAIDPAANVPRVVTLASGANAKVRNKTFMELLLEMRSDVEDELKSGDARIVTTAHRWWVLISAVLGQFDHPAPGHIDMLEAGADGPGQTREQMLMDQLSKQQAEISRLRAVNGPVKQITGASAGTSVRPAPVGDVIDLQTAEADAAEAAKRLTAARNAAAAALAAGSA